MTNARDFGQRGIAMAAVATRDCERTQFHRGQARIQRGAELLRYLER